MSFILVWMSIKYKHPDCLDMNISTIGIVLGIGVLALVGVAILSNWDGNFRFKLKLNRIGAIEVITQKEKD